MNRIPINKPSITSKEIEYVNDAIANGWGEKCYDYIYRFEKDFAKYQKSNYALATSSCTGAIHLALMAMGVKSGDEVIVPEITWIASAEPILYIGAKPVFVDVLEDTWCIDPQKIKESITPKTKVIIVVHLYGNVANMDEILEIAKEHGLFVLEDAAEGLGSECNGRKCGSIGDIGVFSFHGTKTITTGEGGILVTNNELMYKKAKVLNDHGRNPEDPENKPYWMRDYGYKYKMSNIEAAIGCAQIERIDELVSKKREIFNWYQSELKSLNLQMNVEQPNVINSYWLPTLIFNQDFDRDDFFRFSKENGIDSRPFFYPLSSLPMFESNENNKVAYDIYKYGVNLPSYDEMTFEDVKRVCNVIKNKLNG
jgi:perosamine synthetase